MDIFEEIANEINARFEELGIEYDSQDDQQDEGKVVIQLRKQIGQSSMPDLIAVILNSEPLLPIIQKLKKLLCLDFLLPYAISSVKKDSQHTKEQWIAFNLICANAAQSWPCLRKIIELYQQLQITMSSEYFLLFLSLPNSSLEKLVQIFGLLQQCQPTLQTDENVKLLIDTIPLDVTTLPFDLILHYHTYLTFLTKNNILTQKFFYALIYALFHDVSSSQNVTGVSLEKLFTHDYLYALQNLESANLFDKYFLKLSPKNHHIVSDIARLSREVVTEEMINLLLAIDLNESLSTEEINKSLQSQQLGKSMSKVWNSSTSTAITFSNVPEQNFEFAMKNN